MRRGGNGLAMFGSSNFAQLHRHAERRHCRLRLVGRQGLFFGLALGANRGLKRETRSVLSGNVFDRSVARSRWLRLAPQRRLRA